MAFLTNCGVLEPTAPFDTTGKQNFANRQPSKIAFAFATIAIAFAFVASKKCREFFIKRQFSPWYLNFIEGLMSKEIIRYLSCLASF